MASLRTVSRAWSNMKARAKKNTALASRAAMTLRVLERDER